jgi:hypothetical protein
MSNITVSVGSHSRSLPVGRAVLLLVVPALIVVAVLVGRWSVSHTAEVPGQGSIPAPAVSQDRPTPELGGGLVGGASWCLLARPC